MNDLESPAEVTFSSDPQAERLAQSLALADGFQFALVYCDSIQLAARLATWLEVRVASLHEKPARLFEQIVVIPRWKQALSLTELAGQVAAPLVNRAEALRATPVFINAAVIDSAHDSVWQVFLGRLNERRNAIQKRMNAPLTLVLPERFAHVFPTSAPDFWSIRSLEVHIDTAQHVAVEVGTRDTIREDARHDGFILTRDDIADLPEAGTIAAELSAAQTEYDRVCLAGKVDATGKLAPGEARVSERLAIWLERAADHAGRAVRYEEALDHATRSTSLYRKLTELRSDAFLPGLARNLNTLCVRLSQLGRREEALEAAREAVVIRRQLAEAHPEVFLPDLAGSLNNMGMMLSNLGKCEEAVEVSREAVNIYRVLAEARPDAFLPDLAMSLNNFGADLSDLGKREEAFGAASEAVNIYRGLAESRPGVFLSRLAGSIHNLGSRLGGLGRREEALDASREAVNIRRQLAESHPDAFLPDLARSLNDWGGRLSSLGRREEALEATREAVVIRRQLAEARPDAFLPDLAMSLNNLGAMLSDLGKPKEALLAAEESTRLCIVLTRRLPQVFAANLAIAAENLARLITQSGRDPKVDPIVREAREVLRAGPDR